MERKKRLLADTARRAARQAGDPPPTNAMLDLILACWKRTGRPSLRPGVVAAALGDHAAAVVEEVRTAAADLGRLGVEAWIETVAARRRWTVEETVARFTQHGARWASAGRRTSWRAGQTQTPP